MTVAYVVIDFPTTHFLLKKVHSSQKRSSPAVRVSKRPKYVFFSCRDTIAICTLLENYFFFLPPPPFNSSFNSQLQVAE